MAATAYISGNVVSCSILNIQYTYMKIYLSDSSVLTRHRLASQEKEDA